MYLHNSKYNYRCITFVFNSQSSLLGDILLRTYSVDILAVLKLTSDRLTIIIFQKKSYY